MAVISIAPPESKPLQPLESGDSLGAVEFMRRYEAMPDVNKAELIEGIVYMASPVSLTHGDPDSLIQGWLAWYAVRTPGTRASGNITVRLGPKNVPQPDAALRILPEYGGQARPDAKSYLVGAPELIVEVAASSAAIDLHGKLRAYRRAGVREYLVWRPQDRGQFDWFVLEHGVYRPNAPASPGVLRSPFFPGLALAVDALLDDDWAKVLDVLQTSLQDPAHREFVAQLAARARQINHRFLRPPQDGLDGCTDVGHFLAAAVVAQPLMGEALKDFVGLGQIVLRLRPITGLALRCCHGCSFVHDAKLTDTPEHCQRKCREPNWNMATSGQSRISIQSVGISVGHAVMRDI